ncbi:MAG: extracellular solute-binding protein [Treponema sp.]|jgi:raffinose/stachyose/melibiose transport system substrate-binding protein|nr:extracellular solute-binding protein [Treponema sp.]
MKKFILLALILMTAGALVFAAGSKDPGKITLKMGDNHPDRNTGVGAVIERINAEFKAAHPGVEIVTESYQDQPWQEKVKIYATANQLPDVMKYWSFPGMMLPLIDAGLLEKFNKADFANFGYMPGALEGNEFNGSLYGIPVSADLWVLYVNKSLFEKAGVPLPSSWEDIVESVPKFKAINVTPVATDGLEGWPLCELFDNIAQRINGDFSRVDAAITRKAKYTDPDFVQAAAYIQNLIKAGVFNANLTTSDYGDARNQFGQERAAMYMMGSWEMSLATDPNFSENFHNSLDVIKFPVVEGGKGTAEDVLAWFGGNYIITNSKNKALAYEYIKLLGEKFGAYAWEAQAFFPAQKVEARPNDTLVSKKLLQIAAEAKTTSGTPGLDRSNAVFKEDHQELIRQLCALVITPEEFCSRLDASAELASKQ